MPRHRETVAGLVRGLADPAFLRPVAALAGVTGALDAGVGFLPVLGLHAHLSTVLTGACVSLLAATSIGGQLWAGRSLDRRRLPLRAGLVAGLGVAAAGLLAAAWLPASVALPVAAVVIGVGVGIGTPLGFAALAATSERLGAKMGAAEVGRELGEGGGPLLVGALATVSLATGFAGLAVTLIALALAAWPRGHRRGQT